MKKFLVKLTHVEDLPYEDTLMDGLINKNHLMYLAQAQFDKSKKASHNAMYTFFLQEFDEDGKFIEETKL